VRARERERFQELRQPHAHLLTATLCADAVRRVSTPHAHAVCPRPMSPIRGHRARPMARRRFPHATRQRQRAALVLHAAGTSKTAIILKTRARVFSLISLASPHVRRTPITRTIHPHGGASYVRRAKRTRLARHLTLVERLWTGGTPPRPPRPVTQR